MLACAPVAFAQKEFTALKEEMEMPVIGKEKVAYYRALADTATGKPAGFLASTDKALAVGQYNARWAVIRRQGFKFFVSQQALFGTTGISVVSYEESMNAPLPVDAETKLVAFQQVVEVPDVSKTELYSRALEWIAKSYNSAQNVIQLQDKETGKIVIKALDRVSVRGYDAGVVNYTLSIYIKEGRYKYVLTNLSHDAKGAKGFVSGGSLEKTEFPVLAMGGKKPWESIRRQAADDAIILTGSLGRAMKAKGAKDPSDF